MKKAIVVFSRKGRFQEQIFARDVRSREHARKLWPLVASDANRQMVTWVSPVFENGDLRRRSHFRRLPADKTYDIKARFEEEEARLQSTVNESQEHRRAKELIAAELARRLASGLSMPWAFKDEVASDYPLEGNLLLGAERVVTEQPLVTPFGSRFRLDIAVIGPPVLNESMVLGGVEIELGHAFDGRKALIGKSLGFPLISIDISEMAMGDITPQWAERVLTATTRSHELGRRQTYIYLHDLLYPLYVRLPAYLDKEQRHQYLVFSDDTTLRRLVRWLNMLAKTLDYSNSAVAVALVNAKNDQSRKMLERAGQVVGSDWSQFNNHQCLRLTVPRPKGPEDLQAHRFHMTLARLLLSHADALVGYKYRNGVENMDPDENIWIAQHWLPDQRIFTRHRVLPKRLAEPINQIMKVVADLQESRKDSGL